MQLLSLMGRWSARGAFQAGLLCVLLSGCSWGPKVQPWEKQHLAAPEMLLEPDVSASRWMDHIYFSREAVSGGSGLGGGGCGCN